MCCIISDLITLSLQSPSHRSQWQHDWPVLVWQLRRSGTRQSTCFPGQHPPPPSALALPSHILSLFLFPSYLHVINTEHLPFYFYFLLICSLSFFIYHYFSTPLSPLLFVWFSYHVLLSFLRNMMQQRYGGKYEDRDSVYRCMVKVDRFILWQITFSEHYFNALDGMPNLRDLKNLQTLIHTTRFFVKSYIWGPICNRLRKPFMRKSKEK